MNGEHSKPELLASNQHLSCPFCGDRDIRAKFRGHPTSGGWVIECGSCSCEIGPFASQTGAWERWNKRPAAETEVARPQLEWEVTYGVVAYNESWGGYGDNASKEGFQSAEEAIAYAKPLGAHLDATVWQRTKPKSVAQPPSIKIWPAEKASVLPSGCHRSHPHEDMSAECERLTEIARAQVKAAQCECRDAFGRHLPGCPVQNGNG